MAPVDGEELKQFLPMNVAAEAANRSRRTGVVPEPKMSVPQSVAEILNHHVTFQLECIDRMYLNVYVPMLQCESGVARFFRSHRGHLFASSALMDSITKAFVPSMERFSRELEIPIVQFRKGQRKDDVM